MGPEYFDIPHARVVESPDLFGRGMGTSTSGPITCHWCQTAYNVGVDPEGDNEGGERVLFTVFAGHALCECCFAAIEAEIWDRMREILSWYRRVLAESRSLLDADQQALDAVDETDK